VVFAHQGGWDEILAVVGPLLVIAGLLLIANRRATRMRAERGPVTDSGAVENPPDD
jgi:hypothetical protein